MCVSGVADRATHICLNVCAESLQSCLTLCDTVDCSPPGYSVHGILQAGILEWVAIAFSRRSSPPMSVVSPALVGGFFTTEPPLLDMSPTGGTVLLSMFPRPGAAPQ